MRLSTEIPLNLSPSVIPPVIDLGLSDGKTRIVLTITVIFFDFTSSFSLHQKSKFAECYLETTL